MALTEKKIRDLKPGSQTKIEWDGGAHGVPGLGVRVTTGGVKAYVPNFRIHRREKRFTLGRCTAMSLQVARERAGLELAKIRSGEPDPLSRRKEAAAAPTVADLIQQFLEVEAPARIQRGRLKAGTVEVYAYQARRHLLPALGKRRVADVTRGDIERMVARLPGPTHNAVLALVSRLFTLAERWEWRPQHSNPARGVERARVEPRDRVLAPSELAVLARALDEAENHSPPGAVAAVRFASITGLRVGEVLGIKWEHIELESGRLLLPDTKTGRRWHDLPTAAQAILATLPRSCAWTFSTDGKTKPTYKTVRGCFARVAESASLDNVTLHDLRRTVMTMAAAAGVSAHVLRDLLGHRTTVMADRYIRSLDSPLRAARERVADEIAGIMAGGSADVVKLQRDTD